MARLGVSESARQVASLAHLFGPPSDFGGEPNPVSEPEPGSVARNRQGTRSPEAAQKASTRTRPLRKAAGRSSPSYPERGQRARQHCIVRHEAPGSPRQKTAKALAHKHELCR
jgi:hypothetical protein